MQDHPSRAGALKSLLGFLVVIAVGAHLSLVPIFVLKLLVFMLLVGCYGYFTVQTITKLRIDSGNVRMLLGAVLAVGAIWLTWAVRIPASTGWEVPFTLAPGPILEGLQARASGMTVTRGFGHGTTAEAPSGLLIGTYIAEALAFMVVMVLGAALASPDDPKDADTDGDQDTQASEGEDELSQAA